MIGPLEDDLGRVKALENWTDNIPRIAVLGAGHRPLNNFNACQFKGLEGLKHFVPVNVDIRDYSSTDIVMDLSKKDWSKPMGKASLTNSDKRGWGLRDNEFDIVIAEHVAEHVPDRLAFIAECLRITKPNGLLIIEVPNWKHDSAHNTLEHYTTWGRAIFNDSYINDWGLKWKVEKVVYRVTKPFSWESFYVPWEFLGRQIDRFTHKISGLRFFIRVKK